MDDKLKPVGYARKTDLERLKTREDGSCIRVEMDAPDIWEDEECYEHLVPLVRRDDALKDMVELHAELAEALALLKQWPVNSLIPDEVKAFIARHDELNSGQGVSS
ncbi:hypothetical protein ACI2KR_31425 [Pseudomonas luteola]